ncbi:MAG: PVC-type heme-binding CxxCH protein [Planctomyces sp.]
MWTAILRTLSLACFTACSLCTTPLVAQNSAGWHLLSVPDAWRSVPGGELKPIDGYSWYRALVKLPREWQGQPLTLFIEALDDARSASVGGTTVGVAGGFPPQFRSGLGEKGRWPVAAELTSGEFTTVAIRVCQYDPRPNFSVAPPVLMNEARREAIRLEGIWQYHPGDDPAWASAGPADFGLLPDSALTDAETAAKAVYRKIDQVDDIEKYVTRRIGDTDPLSPADALKRFKTPSDLQVRLAVADPDIAQPLFLSWDARGRLWVMEYRQYPDPAGLKMVSRDTFLRTVYDKVPAAPPHHVRGADRISIHEDTDGDGTYEKHSVFVDGLNIASSFAIGRGGVFVTNPPYLLFYPDRNQDDVPDGDPEVLLEGFGLEDSHSVVNSLRFGPDGWLYGGQGSTVTGIVRRPGSKDEPVRSLGQIIWRYHPESRIYEVFAEGGGNTFGCEMDAHGEIFSGHNGGDTRGFHYVQGGYYRKGFGKHGPLSNPWAFGFFEHMRHPAVARFTHNFVIYEEQLLPDRFQGRLFGVEPLQGQVVLSEFRPLQSSFQTEDVERVLKTDDPWFRPVDIKTGPDGDIYVADLYEQRIDHSSHYAGRIHRSSGRVWRLTDPQRKRASPGPAGLGYHTLPAQQLVELLDHPSKWHRQTAVRLLGDRRDATLIPLLRNQLLTLTGQGALERLWALNAVGGFSEQTAIELLRHPDEWVRAWTVRLLCDPQSVSPTAGSALAAAANSEPYIVVRKQLASSARRLPPAAALPILHALLQRDEDATDIHQPLLLWWALEAQVGRTDAKTLLTTLLPAPADWKRPLADQHLAERLMKRYALAGSPIDLQHAATLLRAAPDKASGEKLLRGFEEAFQGRSLAGIPQELADALAASGGGSLALRFRQGQPAALEQAVQLIADPQTPTSTRIPLIEIAGQLHRPELQVTLQQALQDTSQQVQAAALAALMSYSDPAIAQLVLERFPTFQGEAGLAAESLLASRSAWSRALLAAVDSGRISSELITTAAVRRMAMQNDPQLQQNLEKHWPAAGGISAADVQQETARVQAALAAGSGNPKVGKQLFMQNCGRCHLLWEEGGKVGPDLTPFARDNLERMLSTIINPSLEIREGFENYVATTADGRVLNGFLVQQDSQVVILRGVDGQNVILRRDETEELKVLPQSVMPEGTLKTLADQQLRDLFAYLRSTQPVNY